MEWRPATWSPGWTWLEPVLAIVVLGALLSNLAGCVRIRLRRARRSQVPAFVRRIVTLLGLGLALFAYSSPASGRTSAHPGRSERPLLEAPWRRTGGFPPPRPLVPSGSPMPGSPATHPAIHKGTPVRGRVPLFERAGGRGSAHSRASRRIHPAGNPRAVDFAGASSITVREGDCLWTIAAEILNSEVAQRVDAYWREVFPLNRAVVGEDPNRLLPGQVLRLPRKAPG